MAHLPITGGLTPNNVIKSLSKLSPKSSTKSYTSVTLLTCHKACAEKVGLQMNNIWLEARQDGLMFFWIMLGLAVLVMIVWKIKDQAFERGYWVGRSAGWKASIEHNQKIEKLRSRAVFDYDKN